MPPYDRMDRFDQRVERRTMRRRARASQPQLQRLAGRLRSLATDILRDIPEAFDRPVDKNTGISISAADPSPRKGYQWPASALTEQDMRTLDEIRRETNTPIVFLVHEAVSALRAVSMSDMAKLEHLRDQTGRSIRELLHDAVSLLLDSKTQPGVDEANAEQDRARQRA